MGGDEAAAGRIADRINVVLLEGQPLVREGLRALLEREPDIEVTDVTSHLEQAIQLATDPDVIVAELVLGEIRGAAIVSSLRRRFPCSAILVLTLLVEAGEVQAAFAAGADGYSVKDSPVSEVFRAIRMVHRGEGYVAPSLGAALARRARQHAGSLDGQLTTRELEVLRLLALGHTNLEVADRLTIALRTAEAHRANLLGKLGLRTRADLVTAARERSLIGPLS
jgi:two-component system response regulator NreC